MARVDSIHFFAANRDLHPIVLAVEAQLKLRYIRAGLFENPVLIIVTSGLSIPTLGIAIHGDQVQEDRYLVADASMLISFREVPQRNGGLLYAMDQLINPKSIVFRPGGVYETRAVIAGEISTVSADPEAGELMKMFRREVRRHFKKIKSFWVGAEAERLFDAGYRLTTSVKSPPEIDLSRT